ncbi:MAG: hypothetical protein ACK5L7_11325 [Paludibacteraceae bacterium]
MKKKILVTLAVALLTVSSSFAKAYIFKIDCGNGQIHRGYIGGVADERAAMEAAWTIASTLC